MSRNTKNRIAPGGGELAQLADELGNIVLRAGRLVLEAYEAHVPMRLKADRTPVCVADETAEELILDALARAFPGVPAVAEESVSRGAAPTVGDAFFLVDPLDGTREFASRNGEFSVNIAFIRDGAPACGAVYAPVFRTLYLGFGGEARERRIGSGGATTADRAIRTRRASASLDAFMSRSNLNAETDSFLAPLPIGRRTPFGSSVKFCLIAAGEGDLYPRFGPTMEWDTAAGDAVLRAAGGVVVDPDGRPLRYGKIAGDFRSPSFIAWGDPEAAARWTAGGVATAPRKKTDTGSE